MNFKVLNRFLIAVFLVFAFTQGTFKTITYNPEEICVSTEEYKLYQLIMKYRKSKKLPSIPLSKSLTHVAQAHTKDLMDNYKIDNKCNMHSWSAKGKWTSCCYNGDQASAECMWRKPKELTNYQSNGYEIAFFHSTKVTPENALESWQKSNAHNTVIINKGIWKDIHWNAVGISIYKNYSVVWFGAEKDADGEPKKCN